MRRILLGHIGCAERIRNTDVSFKFLPIIFGRLFSDRQNRTCKIHVDTWRQFIARINQRLFTSEKPSLSAKAAFIVRFCQKWFGPRAAIGRAAIIYADSTCQSIQMSLLIKHDDCRIVVSLLRSPFLTFGLRGTVKHEETLLVIR